MPILTKKLPAFTGVEKGVTATCKVPAGYTYHGIMLEGNITADKITEMRVLLNGTITVRLSGNELDLINLFDGMASSNVGGGNHFISFDRLGLRTRTGTESTAIPYGAINDPRPIANMLIEIDISSTAGDDLKMEGYALVSGPMNLGGNPAILKQIRKFNYSPAGAGEFDISDLPRIGLINRIIFTQRSKIDNVVVALDSTEIWNRPKGVNEFIERVYNRRNHLNDFYAIDPSENGYSGDAWNVSQVNDFRIKLHMNDAANITVIVEYLATLSS